MRALVPALVFVAGAAVAASAFWIGRELGGDPSSLPSASGAVVAGEMKAIAARIEDLEARLDSLARAASVAVVRTNEGGLAAGAPRAGGSPASGAPAGSVDGAAPADPNAPGNNRFPGFDELRQLRDAPDDATRLKLARQLLTDANPMTSMSALRVLADLAPKEALATVDEWIAKSAAGEMNAWQVDRALATIVDSKGAALLGTALDAKLREWYSSGDTGVKLTAARSLESRGDSSVMQQLVASYRGDLGNSDVGKRTRAVESLGRTRSAQALPSLLPLLADASDEVRLGALDAIRRTGNEATIEKVTPLLNDPVAAVRDRATRTIESLRRGEAQQDWGGGGFPGFDFRGGRDGGAGRRGGNN